MNGRKDEIKFSKTKEGLSSYPYATVFLMSLIERETFKKLQNYDVINKIMNKIELY